MKTNIKTWPDERGFYGDYGGRFVPDTLMAPLIELEKAYNTLCDKPAFWEEFNALLKNFVGRETPLQYAKRLTEHLKGAKIYLKREDLAHTGAHKINNAIGQALLALDENQRLFLVEGVVAECDGVSACVDQLEVNAFGDAETARSVLSVDDEEIELVALAQARDRFDCGFAACASDDVSKE